MLPRWCWTIAAFAVYNFDGYPSRVLVDWHVAEAVKRRGLYRERMQLLPRGTLMYMFVIHLYNKTRVHSLEDTKTLMHVFSLRLRLYPQPLSWKWVLLWSCSCNDCDSEWCVDASSKYDNAWDSNRTGRRYTSDFGTCKVVGDEKPILYFMPSCDVRSVKRKVWNPTGTKQPCPKLGVKESRVELQTQRAMVGQKFVVMRDLSNRNILFAGQKSKDAHDYFGKAWFISNGKLSISNESLRGRREWLNSTRTGIHSTTQHISKRSALELNLKLNPTALNLALYFCISHNVLAALDCRRKSKAMMQAAFTVMLIARSLRLRAKATEEEVKCHKWEVALLHLRQFCMTKDKKDIRGWWKGAFTVSNGNHHNVELPNLEC